jgi:hypothetical protein
MIGLQSPLDLLHRASASQIGIVVLTDDPRRAKAVLEQAKATSPEFSGFIIRASREPGQLWILKGKKPEVVLTEDDLNLIEELKNG